MFHWRSWQTESPWSKQNFIMIQDEAELEFIKEIPNRDLNLEVNREAHRERISHTCVCGRGSEESHSRSLQ